ncbi:MAG: KH domain-containing protein [Candidatus Nitrosocaldus sp.]|nr:KH domain-containing protein [Candidatus Nitrosocaldus sp.]
MMEFKQVVKVPRDRIGVLIGRDGRVKEMVERSCSVRLYIDSEEGSVTITGAVSDAEGSIDVRVFKAVEFITAVARGFSPERAMRLLNDEECMISVIDLKEQVGRSASALQRVKGRLIGSNGKARRLIEELSGAYISVYGHYVAIIGRAEEVRLAGEAVTMLMGGSMHSTVYSMLQRARRRAKMERLRLWEDSSVTSEQGSGIGEGGRGNGSSDGRGSSGGDDR